MDAGPRYRCSGHKGFTSNEDGTDRGRGGWPGFRCINRREAGARERESFGEPGEGAEKAVEYRCTPAEGRSGKSYVESVISEGIEMPEGIDRKKGNPNTDEEARPLLD